MDEPEAVKVERSPTFAELSPKKINRTTIATTSPPTAAFTESADAKPWPPVFTIGLLMETSYNYATRKLALKSICPLE